MSNSDLSALTECISDVLGGQSPIMSLDELDGANFAISRLGSGSHTMAFVMAKQRGWTKPLQFTVCNDFATMRAKVSAQCHLRVRKSVLMHVRQPAILRSAVLPYVETAAALGQQW